MKEFTHHNNAPKFPPVFQVWPLILFSLQPYEAGWAALKDANLRSQEVQEVSCSLRALSIRLHHLLALTLHTPFPLEGGSSGQQWGALAPQAPSL